MANQVVIEEMVYKMVGDASRFKDAAQTVVKQSATARKSMESTVLQSQAFRRQLRGFAGDIISSITGAVGGLGALNTVVSGIRLASQVEDAQAEFEVLLKSGDRAKDMVKDIRKFAAETPFETPELTKATKALISFGVAAEDVLPILRSVGDVSAGINQPISEIADIFGKAKVQGRLFMEDINQLQGRGIPVLRELAKVTGKSEADMRAFVEGGGANFQQLEQIFRNLTKEGGDFFNMMEKRSKTLSGLFSTLTDDLNTLRMEIGREVAELFHLKEVMGLVSTATQAATNWFTSLDPAVKRMALSIAGVTATVGVLTILWPALSAAAIPSIGRVAAALGWLLTPMTSFGAIARLLYGLIVPFDEIAAVVMFLGRTLLTTLNPLKVVVFLFSTLVGLASTLLSPLALILIPILAIGAGVAAWSDRMGGMAQAWEHVKDQVQGVWEWLRPVRQAVESLADTVWSGLVAAFEYLGEVVLGAVSDGLDAINLDWNKLRDIVRDGILAMEFGLRNFGTVAAVVFMRIRLAFLTLAEEVSAFFGAETDLTSGLRAEVGRLEDELQAGFKEFRGNKLTDWLMADLENFGAAATDEAVKVMAQAGTKAGEALNKGAGKEVGKFDAALAGSAEALTRIAEYRDRMRNVTAKTKPPEVRLGDAVKGAADALKGMGDGMRESANEFKSTWSDFKVGLGPFWETARGKAFSVWDEIEGRATRAWGQFEAQFPQTAGLLRETWNTLERIGTNTFNMWSGVFSKVIEGDFLGAWDRLFDGQIENFDIFFGNLPNLAENAFNLWFDVWMKQSEAIWKGVETAADRTWDAIKGFGAKAWDAVVAYLKSLNPFGGGGDGGPIQRGIDNAKNASGADWKRAIGRGLLGPGGLLFGGALAGGGMTRAGEAYLIGERGPELFVPNRSGTVVPNSAVQGGGGDSYKVLTEIRDLMRVGQRQQFITAKAADLEGA